MIKKKRTYTPQQLAIIRRKMAEKRAREVLGSGNSAENVYSSHVFTNCYPHFRTYKKSKHPALIMELTKHNKTNEDVYAYRDVTHSYGKNYEKIQPNPDSRDSNPMYINNRVRFDIPDNFSDRPLPWKYSKTKRGD